jgi:hypothetical protein
MIEEDISLHMKYANQLSFVSSTTISSTARNTVNPFPRSQQLQHQQQQQQQQLPLKVALLKESFLSFESSSHNSNNSNLSQLVTQLITSTSTSSSTSTTPTTTTTTTTTTTVRDHSFTGIIIIISGSETKDDQYNIVNTIIPNKRLQSYTTVMNWPPMTELKIMKILQTIIDQESSLSSLLCNHTNSGKKGNKKTKKEMTNNHQRLLLYLQGIAHDAQGDLRQAINQLYFQSIQCTATIYTLPPPATSISSASSSSSTSSSSLKFDYRPDPHPSRVHTMHKLLHSTLGELYYIL